MPASAEPAASPSARLPRAAAAATESPAEDRPSESPPALARRGALFLLVWAVIELVWVALAFAVAGRSPVAWNLHHVYGPLFALTAVVQRHDAVGALLRILVTLPLTALFAAFCLAAEHLCRINPLRASRVPAALLHQLETAITLAGIWTLVARGWGVLLARGAAWLASPLLAMPALLFLSGIFFYSLAAAGFYAAQSYARAAQSQKQAAQLALRAREAELRALRSQVNPHFLFNSLHSISALTASDPARAREMCIHLAELFRLTLKTGPLEFVPLSAELEVVRAYLAVERARFGARLRVEEAVVADALPAPVPPLLLQPLVENAIKHGIAGLTRPGVIRIVAEPSPEGLRIEIANDFDPDSVAGHRTGIGLENVRRRLEAAYGPAARLAVAVGEETFRAHLVLPAAGARA